MDNQHILFYNPANGKTSSLDKQFEKAGYKCRYATDREEALQMLNKENLEAVMIYIDNCGEDGFRLSSLIRQNAQLRKIAIIMISADDNEDKIIAGFNAGVDDYVTNLHGPRELIARLKAIVRRTNGFDFNKLRIKDIEIDLENKTDSKRSE